VAHQLRGKEILAVELLLAKEAVVVVVQVE